MTAIRTMLRMLRSCNRGATAIEYGLIASLIVIAMMAGLSSAGGGTYGLWTKISNKTNDAM